MRRDSTRGSPAATWTCSGAPQSLLPTCARSRSGSIAQSTWCWCSRCTGGRSAALLKGWIDRVFVSGWAYDLVPDGGLVKKLDRLTIHLVPVTGDDADTFERHGVFEAFRTEIERGIVEYCGATLGSTTFLHESDTKTRDVLAPEILELAEHVAARIARGGKQNGAAQASTRVQERATQLVR